VKQYESENVLFDSVVFKYIQSWLTAPYSEYREFALPAKIELVIVSE
jgi:hypothetical protein